MKNNKKYYIGLDIGTNSIGYAVTDTNYEPFKVHGAPLFGVMTYEEGMTSAERRTYRTARRRRDREQQRVSLVNEIFVKEIVKKDPGFFKGFRIQWLKTTNDYKKITVLNG